jgi:hypothetical protein
MYIDALFDYLLSIDIKPYVELGFMPMLLPAAKKLSSGGEEMLLLLKTIRNGKH